MVDYSRWDRFAADSDDDDADAAEFAAAKAKAEARPGRRGNPSPSGRPGSEPAAENNAAAEALQAQCLAVLAACHGANGDGNLGGRIVVALAN